MQTSDRGASFGTPQFGQAQQLFVVLDEQCVVAEVGNDGGVQARAEHADSYRKTGAVDRAKFVNAFSCCGKLARHRAFERVACERRVNLLRVAHLAPGQQTRLRHRLTRRDGVGHMNAVGGHVEQ